MCLAVPGRVLSIRGEEPILRVGRVDFGGIAKEINLGFVPEVAIGDHVLVHAGIALAVIDEDEADRRFAALRALEPGSVAERSS